MNRLIEVERELGGVIPLDSLAATVERLNDQKQKYQFFNLNASQTEGLIDYLGKVVTSLRSASATINEGLSGARTSIFTASQKLLTMPPPSPRK